MPKRKRRRGLAELIPEGGIGGVGLTKKHFIVLAEILRSEVEDRDLRCRLAGRVAGWASGENPRFDRARFYAAAKCA